MKKEDEAMKEEEEVMSKEKEKISLLLLLLLLLLLRQPCTLSEMAKTAAESRLPYPSPPRLILSGELSRIMKGFLSSFPVSLFVRSRSDGMMELDSTK